MKTIRCGVLLLGLCVPPASVLTLRTYAGVVRQVFEPAKKKNH